MKFVVKLFNMIEESKFFKFFDVYLKVENKLRFELYVNNKDNKM